MAAEGGGEPDHKTFGQNSTEILFQGFNWESSKYKGNHGSWYNLMAHQAELVRELGATYVWCPPPSDSLSPEGYMPRDLDILSSKYGSADDLSHLVTKYNALGMHALIDTVLNHRCAAHKNQSNGAWTQFGGKYNWDDRAIINNDPSFPGRGNKGTGVPLAIAPNIDHSQDFVHRDIVDWLNTLRGEKFGFEAYRIDYARGFSGKFVGSYVEETKPNFAVGEMWDGMEFDGTYLRPNQDNHRSRIAKWINATGQNAMAFDFTTKGVLMHAVRASEYWRLKDNQGKPAGLIGIWPERAVTFIDNHDTGSSQAHWPFPNDKVMQGYAYILTHPGLPCLFYDHVFDWKLSEPIGELVRVRKDRGICNGRADVKIERADNTGYIARIQASEGNPKQLYVKLGHGVWAPSKERGWELATSGPGYAVWIRDGIPETKPDPGLRRINSSDKPFLPIHENEAEGIAKMKIADSTNGKPQKPVLALQEGAMKVFTADAGNGKKKIVMEYEIDDDTFEDSQFTVTIQGKRDHHDDMITKTL